MSNKINLEIPVLKSVDVAVIGGGTAGCFAAISSAAKGAKTLLVEKNGLLGGTMTAAGVNFPGLFFAWGKQIIAGPCWDSILRTVEAGGATLPEISTHPEKHWQEQIKVDPFVYTRILEQMCIENGVDMMMHTMIASARESDDGVCIICSSKEGLWGVNAKVVIDATGDADVVGLLGYGRVKSEALQPATLINNISGYDMDKVDSKIVNDAFNEAKKAGKIKLEDTQGGDLFSQLKAHRLSMHVVDVDASTSGGKTAAEIKARKKLMEIISFLKTVKGLENIYVNYFAQECGIRETCRIIGEKTVSKDEYLNGYVYDDAICYAFYPIDLHIPGGIKQVFLQENIVPAIPYGALIPKDSKRVLAAGRCISSDTDSNSALRVQAPCMAMGQAAGVAAAIAVKQNIPMKEVPIDLLRRELTEIGAIVPSY